VQTFSEESYPTLVKMHLQGQLIAYNFLL